MPGDSALYWKRARVYPDRNHLGRIDYAIDRLIENGRADAAIQCFWLGDLWSGEYAELGLRALEAFSDENRADAHAIGELFTHLQNLESVDQERLALMEVGKFLRLLDRFANGGLARFTGTFRSGLASSAM